jgi:hypothetical protein
MTFQLRTCSKNVKSVAFDLETNRANRYLAVDYLLAELLLRSYSGDRLSQLKHASELLGSFLTVLDQYDLLSKADQKLYERYQDNKQSFSVVTTSNVEERRNTKVARFREEKALKEKLRVGIKLWPLASLSNFFSCLETSLISTMLMMRP